jgi:glutamine synthetase adenylyltransferase
VSALRDRLAATLHATPWAAGVGDLAETLSTHPDVPEALLGTSDAVFAGTARAAASHFDAARFLGHRPRLARRLASLEPEWLAERTAQLDAASDSDVEAELEDFLDDLRLLRREETVLAACLDLGGLARFEDVSELLSALAENVVRRALHRARVEQDGAPDLAVIAMGKLGGREFTYQSDLDLIFLHGGGVETIHPASRLAQRLIHYVSTMTGAGIAYVVDARLRPSGRQGTLVTSYASFERYQVEEAATWEHLAAVRARVIAGALREGASALGRVENAVWGSEAPWKALRDMRHRVEAERADESEAIELKTGPGGLMDAEFLAQGTALERGTAGIRAAVRSVPALLGEASGRGAEEVIAAYQFLRRVESRVRWIAGRAVESVERDPQRLDPVAELVEPGLRATELTARLEESRATLRRAFDRVCDAGTAEALGDPHSS